MMRVVHTSIVACLDKKGWAFYKRREQQLERAVLGQTQDPAANAAAVEAKLLKMGARRKY
jgi:hypothetical protein